MINLTNKFIEPRRFRLQVELRKKIANRIGDRIGDDITVWPQIRGKVFNIIWIEIRRHLVSHTNDKIK